jgi:hypothetical protein
MRACATRSADPLMMYPNIYGHIYIFVEEVLLGAFTELKKGTVGLILSVRLS